MQLRSTWALACVVVALAIGCAPATVLDAGPADGVDADHLDAALDAGEIEDAGDASVDGGLAPDATAPDGGDVADAGDLADAQADDAGSDAGSDSGSDAGSDAGIDAGIDAGRDAGVDAGRDAGLDAGRDAGHDAGRDAGHDAGRDAGLDAGRDAGLDAGWDAGLDAGDRCAGVTCEGTPCRDAFCDPATGACVAGAAHADGTRCDDGNACTIDDSCQLGTCAAGPAVVCRAVDACHAVGVCDPVTGVCSSPPTPCATEVLVRVRDARGAVLATPPIVRAFEGWGATPHGGQTDAAGEIRLTLPAGTYWFRALRDGLPFWSGAIGHCRTPTCTFVEMRLPDTTPDRVVSWDPLMDGAYDDMGEIVIANPHIERGGTYLENWGIQRYGYPDALLASAHTHIWPEPYGAPDPYGNPTHFENQHAFGEMLQGVFVRLDTRGPFDLISVDYRTRHDGDPEHVCAIPGADPANVEIWISDRITLPTTPFHRYSTGKPFDAAMTYWGTVFPTELTNVTGVYIATTGNVSIDNVVVRPR